MIIYNGKLISENELHLHINNRSFRYGDGCFESIRLIKGKGCFLYLHYKRLLETISFLKINLPNSLSFEVLESNINALAKANGIGEGGYARLTIFRGGGGFYQPECNEAQYIIEASPLQNPVYTLNKEGLKIGIYSESPKATIRMSNFKTNNSLHYVLASIFIKENGLDDCLLINTSGNIVETSNSNVFVVFKDKIVTPPLFEGCVDGVARRVIFKWAKKFGVSLLERPIYIEELSVASEIIVCNAVRGPRWAIGLGNGLSTMCALQCEFFNQESVNY